MQWSRQHALGAAVLLVVLLFVILLQKGLWKGGFFHEGRFNDFRAYDLAARGVWLRDLVPSYRDEKRPNLYPPTFAILVAPLGLLPPKTALLAWVLLNGCIALYIFRRLGAILAVPLTVPARVAGLLLVYRLLESDFSNGNANLLVLGLILGAFDWARHRGAGFAGCILASAMLAKVSPVLLLPWIIYRRRWRMLLGVAVGAVVLGGILPAVVLGPRGAADAWKEWRSGTLEHIDPRSPSYGAETSGYEPGQSLRTLIHRLLRRSDATSHDEDVISIHVLDASKGTADLVYWTSAACILAAVLAAAWRRAPGRGLGWRPDEIAAACAAMVLLAPLSRKAHFVALWPAAVLGFDAWRLSEGKWRRSAGAILWFLALALVVGTSPGLVTSSVSKRLLAYCPMAWASLSLLVLMSWPGFFPGGSRTVQDLEREDPACPLAPTCAPRAPDGKR